MMNKLVSRTTTGVAGALAVAALAAAPTIAGAHSKHEPCGRTKPKHHHLNCGKHKGWYKDGVTGVTGDRDDTGATGVTGSVGPDAVGHHHEG